MKMKNVKLAIGASLLALTLVACSGGDKANGGNDQAKNNKAKTENTANASKEGESGDLAKLGQIAVISREDGSGTRGAFTEITGLVEKNGDQEVDNTTASATVQNSTNGVMTTVAGNPSAIGYISLGSLNDTVKALTLEGVEATPENILSGEYKLARPFLLVTKGEPKEGSLEADFIKFALSKDGQAIAEQEGYVKNEKAEDYKPGNVSGEITVAGSTSVTPLMEKLVEAYKKVNSGANIQIQSNGSSAGITAAAEGTAQIGMSSRELKDEEKTNVQGIVLAQDGIAVIVNKENPAKDITMEQIKNIFNGSMAAWGDLAK
ncbi:substrate-binding domain-containing protein [Aedoeadaptatus urinae]|uniref:substrate-binding domain-containing protein n=1 Tax=Aedoeadaptatus urinae TaxID=1871017 RepID=UPI00097DD038|nr:substrate-binding domain-containing protein [Peptoniphilus urinae]